MQPERSKRKRAALFAVGDMLKQRTKLNKQKFFSHEHVKCDKIE